MPLRKGITPQRRGFFEEPAPNGEAVAGAGTLTARRPGTSRTPTLRRRTAWKGGQDNECPYVCQSQNCKRKFGKHYGRLSESTGVGENPPRNKRACHERSVGPAYRKAPTSQSKLGIDYTGPLDNRKLSGSQARIDRDTSPEKGSRRAPLIPSARSLHGRRNFKASAKGGNYPTSTPTSTDVCVQDLSSAKEGWLPQANSGPSGVKQVYTLGAFQDGRNPSSQGHSTGRGLDGETRPKRRILFSANSPGAQAVPANSMERYDIPIQLPTLRTVVSPEGVHQNHASSDSMAETAGVSDNHLHRRQPHNGVNRGAGPLPSGNSGGAAGSTRVCDKSPQVHPPAMPRATVSGLCHQLEENDNSSATRKAVKNSDAGKRGSESNLDNGKRDSQFGRNSFLDGTGHSTSPAILQGTTASKECCHSRSFRPRRTDTDRPTPEGGASVVGGASSSMELSLTLSTREEPLDSNRCVQDGLGCLLPGRKNRGCGQ